MNPRLLSTNTGRRPHKAALSLILAITVCVTFAVAGDAHSDDRTPQSGDKYVIDPQQFKVRRRIKLDHIPGVSVSSAEGLPGIDSFDDREEDQEVSEKPFVYSPMGKKKTPELVLDTGESPLHEPWLKSEETHKIPTEEAMDKMKEDMRKQMEQEAVEKKKSRFRLPKFPKFTWNPFAKSKSMPNIRVPSLLGEGRDSTEREIAQDMKLKGEELIREANVLLRDAKNKESGGSSEGSQ